MSRKDWTTKLATTTRNYIPIETLIDAHGSVFPSELAGYAAGAAAVDLLEHWDTCDPPLDAATRASDVQDVIEVLTRWQRQIRWDGRP